ncbi:actin-related protein 6-like [Glycine soja]|uniref:actin-related protein 6-like n=1 Tax=Glycine soja TaxID=3848 RepID=UPI00103E47FC|nr:actin-related protein 6-like [Glycine soja]
MSTSTNLVVLDNGGGLIKAGIDGEHDPFAIVPNCLYRPPTSKKWLHLYSGNEDLTSAAMRYPVDRGYLINPDLQHKIWSHLFSSVLHTNPSKSSLILTEPLFTAPSIQRSMDELVFKDFNFWALYLADSASIVYLYKASRNNANGILSKAQQSLVVDLGFSFTHTSPVFHNFALNYAIRRIDLSGKALTNYLKDLVSFRSVNIMEETFIINDVKEKLCGLCCSPNYDILLTEFVKYPDQAQHYLALRECGLPSSPSVDAPGDVKCLEIAKQPEDRKIVDLTKNEFDLTNKQFLVPKMIFRPADLGLSQVELVECIVRVVNVCHPHLHPVLYESIILTGESTLFPQFVERLEKELRPLVPNDYRVKIATQEDPLLGVWRGGSLLASSPDFEAMCVTKSEYEELGSARCRKRFFH